MKNACLLVGFLGERAQMLHPWKTSGLYMYMYIYQVRNVYIYIHAIYNVYIIHVDTDI